jgi:release factor glutamine methyltransferase
MKLNEVLTKSIQFFKDKKIDTARLDAELLISHALKIDRMGLYLKYDQPLTDAEVSECREMIRRRSLGEPVAYIVQEKGFYGLNFFVEKGVLVPRPETEMIVDEVLLFINLQAKSSPIPNPRILDLGTGSGCVGLSILKNLPEATLIAIDKSEISNQIFSKNAEALGLSDRCQFISADIDTLDFSNLGLFDFIVSNPPYIDMNDPRVQKSVRDFEPEAALFATDRGFSLLKSWSKKSIPHLKDKSLMIFEMGMDQGSEMLEHFQTLAAFNKVSVLKDLSGLDRFIKAVR